MHIKILYFVKYAGVFFNTQCKFDGGSDFHETLCQTEQTDLIMRRIVYIQIHHAHLYINTSQNVLPAYIGKII